MRPFAVAGIQMDVVGRQTNLPMVEKNLGALLEEFPWVEMVLLSELAVCGHHKELAEPLPGPTEEALRDMAARHGVWFIPGSLYERAGEAVYNTAVVIDPSGNVVGRYRKMFPFLPYESGVSAGREPFVFEVPEVGRFGVSICYDIWFPETSRSLVCHGAEVILHPSLTSTIDRDVELAIVRATAATNQCYVIDVNGTRDGGTGRSIFVGPAGDVLHLAGTSPEDIPFEIDLDRVNRSRAVGVRGLGQPLKSFRDRAFDFDIYAPRARCAVLDALGPLQRQERGDRRRGLQSPGRGDGGTR